MKTIKINSSCPGCKEEIVIEVNLFTAEVKIVPAKKPAGYGMKMAVVEHYKKVKHYDKLSTWDGTYKGRAMKAAAKILHLFRKVDDPVDVAKELISDIKQQAWKESWGGWTIDTCATRAGEWWTQKIKQQDKVNNG